MNASWLTSSNGNIFPLMAFCEGIHRSPMDSPHGGQWRRALMFCLICVNNKRLSKQSRRRWLKTPSRSWWRHCNDLRKINMSVWSMSVWSKRNAFSKGRLWSQRIDRLHACSMSFIFKIYWLFYPTLCQWLFHGLISTDSYCHGAMHDQSTVSVWPAMVVVTRAV